MLLVMLGAIFIGIPISLTLLFLALIFGYIGLGDMVFDLAYLQIIGMMKQDEFVAVPMCKSDALPIFFCEREGRRLNNLDSPRPRPKTGSSSIL